MTVRWMFVLSTVAVISACKSKVAEVEGPIPLETPIEEFTFSEKKIGEFTFRDAIHLHQVVLEKVAEGENHTLIERRDELNATMMEQGCTREMDEWGTVWSQLTPLFLACWAKKPEAALILLEEGADPNILALQTFTGGEQVEMSALYAAEGPKMDEVRDALFENGADGFLKTSSLQYLPTWPKWVLEQRG